MVLHAFINDRINCRVPLHYRSGHLAAILLYALVMAAIGYFITRRLPAGRLVVDLPEEALPAADSKAGF